MHEPDGTTLLTRKDFRAKLRALVPAMSVSKFLPWACVLLACIGARHARAESGSLAMIIHRQPPVTSEPVPRAEPPAVPELGLLPGQSLVARLRTSLGAIECTLAVDTAPVTVATFVGLARGHREWIDPRDGQRTSRPLYDGTVFHRVVPEFLIQGGDPAGTGTGGPGFSIPDENLATAVFDRAGILGLASRGANTGGSQFFITAGPARHLDGRFTRFGTCDNLPVIAAIATVPRTDRNRPVRDVVLHAVEVVAR